METSQLSNRKTGKPQNRKTGETHARRAFSLVEVLVALAIAGLVLIPGVLLMQRLLRNDRHLDETVATQIRSRECPPCPAFSPEP